MAKKNNNLLDYRLCLGEAVMLKIDEEKRVFIEVENKGFFAFIARKLFGAKEKTEIKVDEMGGYFFTLIDGRTTVYEIARQMRERFKQEAEPLYPRLIKYIELMLAKGVIVLKK